MRHDKPPHLTPVPSPQPAAGATGDIRPSEGRDDRLVDALREELRAHGSISLSSYPQPLDASTWRAAARRAARSLGRPVRTGLGPADGDAWAILSDWPATQDEQRQHEQDMRRAINALHLPRPE